MLVNNVLNAVVPAGLRRGEGCKFGKRRAVSMGGYVNQDICCESFDELVAASRRANEKRC
jgi:hypothetical protein